MAKMKTKIWVSLLICLIVLFASGLLFIHSGRFHEWLRIQVTEQIETAQPCEVHLGRLQGSLIRQIVVDHLAIRCGDDTLLHARRLHITWRPLQLLRKRLAIDLIELEEPVITLRQNADSSWNYHAFIHSESDSHSTNWTYRIRDLRLVNGAIHVESLNPSPTPHHWSLDSLTLHAAGRFGDSGSEISITGARGRILPEDIFIHELVFASRMHDDQINIDSLLVCSNGSRLHLTGEGAAKPPYAFSLHVMADSLDLHEVAKFTTTPLLETKLAIDITAQGRQDLILWQNRIANRAGALSGSGHWMPEQDSLTVHAQIDSLKLDNLTGYPGLVHGVLTLTGSGLTADSATWSAQLHLQRSRFMHYGFDDVQINCQMQHAKAQFSLATKSPWGRIQAQGSLDLASPPDYHLNVQTSDLDVAFLSQTDSLQSRSQFALHLDGSGWTSQDARLAFRLSGKPGLRKQQDIDTLLVQGHYAAGLFILDTLLLHAPWLSCAGSGLWDSRGNVDAQFSGEIDDSTAVKSYLNMDRLGLHGGLHGHLSGRLDSLQIKTEIELDSLRYESLHATGLSAMLTATLAENLNVALSLQSGSLDAGRQVHLDSLSATANLAGKTAQAEVTFINNHVPVCQLQAAVLDQDTLWQIDLTRLDLLIDQLHWRLDSDSTRFSIAPHCITINRFAMSQGAQRIYMHGLLSLEDTSSMVIGIEQFDFARLQDWMRDMAPVNGTLTGRVDLEGTIQHPSLSGSLRVDQPVLAGFAADSLVAQCTLRDSILTWQARLSQNPQNSLSLTGFIPLHLAWPLPRLLIPADEQMRIQVLTKDLQISFLSAASSELFIKGLLNGEIIIENTLADLRPGGYLQLSGGSLMAPYLGKPYHDIGLRIDVTPEKLSLRNLSVQGATGRLTGTGDWQISRLSRGLRFKEMDLRLRADDFAAADGDELTIVLSGDLRLSGPQQQPRLDGRMKVTRGRVNLPAFTETPSTLWQADQPLLMVALADSVQQSYDRSKLMPSWLSQVEKMRGSIKVEIPRNTWLRSPEMNIEIAGEMDVVKDAPAFSLFGAIRIIRGNYELYSRRFDIKEGTLTFSGGDNLPKIDFTAQHVFRTPDKSKHILSLIFSGDLEKPELQFRLDDNTIPEADAVSYLVFGRSFDDLTRGEKSDLAAGQTALGGDAVKQLIAGQIAGQVTRSIQNTLNLDVIEFKGDQNWRQATVVVGKYLTNDLYVSYERQLSLGRSNEVVPEQMTLEYEIIRSLYLQATRATEQDTGFDIIWKWER